MRKNLAPDPPRAIHRPYPMKTLLLWDIDGTLTLSGGAGMQALESALRREFDVGAPAPTQGIDFAGRTDTWIMRQIFARLGLPDSADNLARLLRAYLAELPEALKNPDTRILPGVTAALDLLAARADYAQALLTGNVERGARIKLTHLGLSRIILRSAPSPTTASGATSSARSRCAARGPITASSLRRSASL